MKNPFKYIVICCFLLTSCGSFTNPFNDCFLDWNVNCIDKEKQELSKNGYIYTYPGNKDEAKRIFDKCILESGNNVHSREQCLLKNGFEN